MSLSLVAASAASAGQYVAAYFDAEGRTRTFWDPTANSGSGGPINGIASSLPSIGTITQILDPQGGTTGGWKVHLVPAAVDTVFSSSPMNPVLDQRAMFVIASTVNG